MPFVGIALHTPDTSDPSVDLVPVIVWRAIPGTLINVRPPDKWCVAQENTQIYESIDPTKFGKDGEVGVVGKIDFSDGGKNRVISFTGSRFM